MSFFTGTKDQTKVWTPPFYKQSRKFLYDLMNSEVPDFPVQNVPGMSEAEQQSQSLLAQYMNTSLPSDYSLGMDELRKTVQGGYDPMTSPEYQGYREASKLEEEDTVNALRRHGQLVGMGASPPLLGQEGKLRRGYSADRMSYLGSLMNSERNRQLGATGQLMEGADYASALPLRQATAGQSLGALPREIEAQQEEALFNSIMQELLFPYEVQGNIASTLGGSGSPQMYVSKGGPSDLQKFNQAASDSAMTLALGGLLMSDRNVKENIEQLEITDPIAIIKSLKPCTYNYKGQAGKRIGFIAQDVEKVYPEAVIEIKGVKHVDLYAMQTLIIAALAKIQGA